MELRVDLKILRVTNIDNFLNMIHNIILLTENAFSNWKFKS
ncbi:hypothetical protein ES703_96056 [subsurface metagenome]